MNESSVHLPPPASPRPAPHATVAFTDAFDAGSLDERQWLPISDGDFEERIADVLGARLRLRAATRGTRADTVKYLGVRSASLLKLGERTRLSVELDWNHPSNGSYLSAGVVLAPALTTGNPLATQDFLRVEYVGVPPGKKGRIVVVARNAGREQYLFTEGWPEVNRAGREIGLQQVDIVIQHGAIEVWENGHVLYQSRKRVLDFDSAYLYLQMSSHSNYPPREVYFDNVRVWNVE